MRNFQSLETETDPSNHSASDTLLSKKAPQIRVIDDGDDKSHSGEAFVSRRNKKWLLHPDSTFRKIWIQITLTVALYIVWVTPVRVGFNLPAEGAWFWLEGLIDIFFFTDLVLNFFTSYEDQVTGVYVTDHKKICKRYLKTWFVVDFLATFPVEYIIRGVEGTWLCSIRNDCYKLDKGTTAVGMLLILRILRLSRIFWIVKNFKHFGITTYLGRILDDLYVALPLVSLVELLIVLLYLGHISGCFFYYFSGDLWWTKNEKELIQAGELTTWVMRTVGGFNQVVIPSVFPIGGVPPMPTDTLAQDSISKIWYLCPDYYQIRPCMDCPRVHLRCHTLFDFKWRYVTALYWAYTTMTTVGYGDISATTMSEKIWSIIVMIITGFFFSFCIGRMASVVSKLDAHKSAHKEQVDNVTQFMKDAELPRAMARRVLEFVKKQKVKAYDRQQVLNGLPFEMRAKILRFMYEDVIRSVALLSQEADDDVFLTDVCLRLQPYHCSSNTFVYQRGETGGDVYILLDGDLFFESLDVQLPRVRIPERAIFGEGVAVRHLEGLPRGRRTESVIAVSSCNMLRIAHEDIMDLCDQYPHLAEGLHNLYEQRQARLGQQLLIPMAHSNSTTSITALKNQAMSKSYSDITHANATTTTTTPSATNANPFLTTHTHAVTAGTGGTGAPTNGQVGLTQSGGGGGIGVRGGGGGGGGSGSGNPVLDELQALRALISEQKSQMREEMQALKAQMSMHSNARTFF